MVGICADYVIGRRSLSPFFYLSGATDDDTLQRAKSSEPLNYLIKPIRMRELSIIVDMTLHRHRMAQQLKAAEAQLRYKASLMKYMLDAVIVTDANFIIQEWNPAAETLYGWRAEEMIGRWAGDTIPTIFPGALSADVLDIFHQTGFWRGEAIQQTKEGRLVHVLASVSAVTDEGGRIVGILIVSQDITAANKRKPSV
jgi:PAS domain S-box-containing protein